VILTYAGLAFILGLMLFVIFLDVSRIKDWFF
jgi:membrane-associated protease RseP (regulator of RpoE activity)